jgi:hypothetical protein
LAVPQARTGCLEWQSVGRVSVKKVLYLFKTIIIIVIIIITVVIITYCALKCYLPDLSRYVLACARVCNVFVVKYKH